MGGRMSRATAAVVLAVAAGVSGCSDGDVSDVASRAASVGAEATAAASSLASQGAEALASATAEVRRELDSVKGGVDAESDVTLGDPETDGDGRTTVEVTARNTTDEQRSFAVQVDFRDSGGNLLDVVLVTVPDVAANASGKATARSTHRLSGTVRARVANALRY
ncbi:FxLYD domain-containing protein [Streptomyces sp. XM83C]|jgi:hypothetical protein|uniref:FxLYD domain-containing protein n=1 Tax=Streptomyces thermocoprophilus TaxID=78356 RepID=A0ABV5V6Z8_9ACTN|nr:FxLYD domain-containing protein [Streptomyces sp. XM83C]MCK1819400.1 FxLYD domain-containing protein [Streptomyces sp. XM83C]